MAASTNPFVLQGTLSYPPDNGQQQVPVPFSLSGSYTALMDERLTLTGSGSTVVAFGSITNAKVLLVEYEAAEGALPVNLNFNGGSDDIELTSGGFIAIGSPNPVAGLTSLTIVRTGDATVRVRLLG